MLSYVHAPVTASKDCPRRLELHDSTCIPSLVNATGFAFPYGNDRHYLIPVRWSISPSIVSDDTSEIKLLLFPGSSDIGGGIEDRIMVLRPCREDAETYERIGVAELERSGLFLEGSWVNDNMEGVGIPNRVKSFELEQKWWLRCFTPEVIAIV